jgi:hypothetical protein
VLSVRRPTSSSSHAMPCLRRFERRPARFEGEGPATPALRCPGRDAVNGIARRNAARGISWCGTCVPDVQSFSLVFGAGIEPATNRITICRSNRLSYPSGDVPESNRRPANQFRCSTRLSYRHRETSSPGIGHTPRQCRAYRMGRFFNTETHTAEYRSIDASYCRLSPTGNAFAQRFYAALVATRVEHRDAARCASWRNPRLHDPCLDLDIRTFGAGCCGKPVGIRGCRKTEVRNRSRRESSRALHKNSLCECRKRKTPGWVSEGVRMPRRSG